MGGVPKFGFQVVVWDGGLVSRVATRVLLENGRVWPNSLARLATIVGVDV